MNRSRKLLLAGVGAITPAFVLTAGAAGALHVQPAVVGHLQDAILASERDKAALQQALMGERLEGGGDRFRVADKRKPPPMSDINVTHYYDKASPKIFKTTPAPSGPSIKAPRDAASGMPRGKRQH